MKRRPNQGMGKMLQCQFTFTDHGFVSVSFADWARVDTTRHGEIRFAEARHYIAHGHVFRGGRPPGRDREHDRP